MDGVVHPLGSGHRFHGELCGSAGEFAHPLEHEVGGAVGGGDVGGEQAPPLRGPFGGAVGRCGGQGEDREPGGQDDGLAPVGDGVDGGAALAGPFVHGLVGHAGRVRLDVLDLREERVAPRGTFPGGFDDFKTTWDALQVAYFTSEADAREGESKAPPPELAAQMPDFEALMANVDFIDLRDPWLF